MISKQVSINPNRFTRIDHFLTIPKARQAEITIARQTITQSGKIILNVVGSHQPAKLFGKQRKLVTERSQRP